MPHRLVVLAALAALTAGCASTPDTAADSEAARSPDDPWEAVNRPIKAFNDTLDKFLLKPVAKGYEVVTPRFFRRGVSNFSRNLRMPLVGVNDLLQGKGQAAINDLGSFLLNSTFGIAGILDLATPAGFEQNNEDFGQTLAVWGVPSGPYVVLPFFGPSTLRDALMSPLNIWADPLIHLDDTSIRDKLLILRTVNQRQQLFAAEKLLEDSPDEYVTIRESFLQRREYLIYDGDPPVDEDFYEDFYDDLPEGGPEAAEPPQAP